MGMIMTSVMINTQAGLELMMMVILIMIMMMMMIIGDDNDGGRPSSSDKCAVQPRRGAPTLNTLLQIIRSFSVIIKIIPNYNDFENHTSKSRSCKISFMVIII